MIALDGMDYWSWEGRPCPEYWTKPPASYLERVDVDPLFLPLLLLNCSRSVGSGRPFEISQLDDSASSAFSLILPMWLCAMLIPFSWGFEPFPRRTLSRFPRFSILRLDSHFLFVRLVVDYSIKSRFLYLRSASSFWESRNLCMDCCCYVKSSGDVLLLSRVQFPASSDQCIQFA